MNPISILLRDNWHAFQDINGMAGHQPLLDPVMVFSANDLILLFPLLLLLAWFAFARWSPLATSTNGSSTPLYEYDRRLGQRMTLLGVAAVAIALAFNLTLGHLFYEPRPFVAHPGAVHLLIAHATDASFPSDHEAVAGAVTSILVLYLILTLLSRWRYLRQRRQASFGDLGFSGTWLFVIGVTIVALGAVTAIGVARVYVGVHYPGDIIGGVVCGFIGALLVTAARPLVAPLLTFTIRIAEHLHLA